MKIVLKFLFSFSILFSLGANEAIDWRNVSPPSNFTESKYLLIKLYQKYPRTIYCDCHFNQNGEIDRSSTNHLPAEISNDMLDLEWEHIVPASALGRSMDCWVGDQCPLPSVKPGRACCQKSSKKFQLREANLYNLVPITKYANRKRSNFKPAVVHDKSRATRVCKLWIDKNKRIFEPDDDLKGFIARTYLKIHHIYQFDMTPNEKRLYESWSALFPPSLWELEREAILNQIYNFE